MALTYRQLYDQALSLIKSSCYNVSNYGALPSAFKPGYSESRSSGIESATLYIDNPVSSVSASTVESDFNKIMADFDVMSRLDQDTSPRGMINFYAALSAFIQTKLCICHARGSNRYICYEESNSVTTIPSIPEGFIAYAADASTICTNIMLLIANNAKARPITYSLSI